MEIKFYLLAFFLQVIMTSVTTYTGTLNGGLNFQQQTFSINPGSSILSIQFDITNQAYPNALIYVSFSPVSSNLTLSQIANYLANNSPELAYMDPISAIGGDPQTVNLYIPNNAIYFYIGFFNFDLPEVTTSKNFYLLVGLSNSAKFCATCPSGTSYTSGLSCQCQPCSSGYIGQACQYNLKNLDQGTTTFFVYNNQNQYYLIADQGSAITFSVQEMTISANAVRMYVQYQYQPGMLAGKLDMYYTNPNSSYQFILSNSPINITIPSKGLGILLTFRNYGSSYATVAITYGSVNPVYLSTTIILAVCFSIIGAIIIVVVVIRARKYFVNQNLSVSNSREIVIINNSNLTDDEINKYFPEVRAAAIIQRSEINPSTSELNLNDSTLNQEEEDLNCECSICFDNIKRDEMIRVTYCKHIFHGRCLVEWFHKNPTCPNCRQVFDYGETRRLRANIPKKSKANPTLLVKNILGENFLEVLKNSLKVKVEKKLKKEIDNEELDYKLSQEEHESSNTQIVC